MAKKLNGRLMLTKIPKNLIQSAADKDGNVQKFVYVDIVPNKNGADQYGNTHSIQLYDKENKQVIYLGNLKPYEFGGQGSSQKDDGDLPF
jgi:hypothetical protein|nr:MAG TPA: hypothetical protein [Caudoviricetes sp.]